MMVKTTATFLKRLGLLKPVFDFEIEPQQEGFDELLRKINLYFASSPKEKDYYRNELFYLNNKLAEVSQEDKLLYAVYPYNFVFEYDYRNVEVFRDEEAGMFYVYLEGKKLYYHKGFTNKEDVQKNFTYVSAEQDVNSPHRYLDDFFKINENDVVADLGAAEGNFSLMVVDKVKELDIVEADPVWIEALNKTFEPWEGKVRIINKSVGTTNDKNTITLDRIERENKLSAIKIDIEGSEFGVLEAAQTYLKSNKLKLAVTVYHKHNDAGDIKALLEKNQYSTAFSENFMLFVFDKLTPPYFRPGLIRAIHSLSPR